MPFEMISHSSLKLQITVGTNIKAKILIKCLLGLDRYLFVGSFRFG